MTGQSLTIGFGCGGLGSLINYWSNEYRFSFRPNVIIIAFLCVWGSYEKYKLSPTIVPNAPCVHLQ